MNLNEALREVKRLALANKLPSKHWGICSNLRSVSSQEFGGVDVCFHYESWPHYSGHAACPVPDGKGGCPSTVYFDNANPKWDRRTRYGKLRFALLNHLIEVTA